MFILTHCYKLTDDNTRESRYWRHWVLTEFNPKMWRQYLSFKCKWGWKKILLQKKFCFKRKFLLTYFRRQIKSLDPSLISFIFPKKIDSNGWTIDKQVREIEIFFLEKVFGTNIINNYAKKYLFLGLLWCFSEVKSWNKYKIGETFDSIYKVFSFLY